MAENDSGIERGAADERAVHISLAEQLGGVLGLTEPPWSTRVGVEPA